MVGTRRLGMKPHVKNYAAYIKFDLALDRNGYI